METGYQRGKIQDASMLYEHHKYDGSLPIISVNTFLNPNGNDNFFAELVNAVRYFHWVKSVMHCLRLMGSTAGICNNIVIPGSTRNPSGLKPPSKMKHSNCRYSGNSMNPVPITTVLVIRNIAPARSGSKWSMRVTWDVSPGGILLRFTIVTALTRIPYGRSARRYSEKR